MRQHIRRWFGLASWLGPLAGVCIWVGGSALPPPTARDTEDDFCTTTASAVRPPQPGTRPCAEGSDRSGGDRRRYAAGLGPEKSLQRDGERSPQPGGRRDAGACLRAEPRVEQRLCDRPGNARGGGSLAGRLQSAAHRPVMGFEDLVGRQQRQPPQIWQFDADRRTDGQSRPDDPDRRSLQPLFHAGRPFGDRGRRAAQAARLS